MQPLYGCTSCTVARALTRGLSVSRNTYGIRSKNHGVMLSIMRHASSSKAPTPSKKPASKPLPYQPAQPKTQLNPRVQQQQQQQQESNKSTISDLVRQRWFAIFGFGSALACLGYFTASLTIFWRSEPAPCYELGCEPQTPTGRPSIQSPYEFDLHLDKSEWRYGITKLRREISTGARGHVLEVAIGTGRNLEFYPWDVVTASLTTPEERAKAKAKTAGWFPNWGPWANKGSKTPQGDDGSVLSFTGVDISPGMLDIALQRVRQVVPHMTDKIPKKPSFAMLAAKNGGSAIPQGHVVSFLSDRIRLIQSDAQSGLPAPPTLPSPSSPPSSSDVRPIPEEYDTILQSFGLCSVQDPVSLLSLMASSLQPNTGRILLLEHGRSVWDLVNGLLDRSARAHHERFGCWWNRDIEAIVREAARRVPGLEILRLERPGWTTGGTHVLVELRVAGQDEDEVEPKPKTTAKQQKVTSWASVLQPFLSRIAGDDPKKT
ncbi:hypothetical protein F5B18DRAFT_30248 [Nemania serpens]|nr:hypothetical protein F5B18DRAFT_30248 [Nemania serpens]